MKRAGRAFFLSAENEIFKKSHKDNESLRDRLMLRKDMLLPSHDIKFRALRQTHLAEGTANWMYLSTKLKNSTHMESKQIFF